MQVYSYISDLYEFLKTKNVCIFIYLYIVFESNRR